jgi:type IV fimbrial biogenesis protein FimT
LRSRLQCSTHATPAGGRTLIELLFVLGVLAGLASWALPGLAVTLRNAAQTTRVNLFVQAVHLARTEAIKRNGVVSLCPSADGATCRAGGSWTDGWIVFVNDDRDSPAVRDAGEQLLRAYPRWDGGHVSSNRATLSFRAFGQMGVTATVAFCDDRGPAAAKAVIISQTGRPRIATRSASGALLPCI